MIPQVIMGKRWRRAGRHHRIRLPDRLTILVNKAACPFKRSGAASTLNGAATPRVVVKRPSLTGPLSIRSLSIPLRNWSTK